METDLQRIVKTPPINAKELQHSADQIGKLLLSKSRYIDDPNFRRIHPDDLEFAFDEYDRRFFNHGCRKILQERNCEIRFLLSKRMTRAGGMTVRHEQYGSQGEVRSTRFEIKLSTTLLFSTFRDHRMINVSGRICRSRLEAMQRIVEHEMIHLIEMLLWYDSSCSKSRFRGIANRLFNHTESTHQLITPVEMARDQFGIRPGDRVTFRFQNRHLEGRVNRITRRATVLVADPRGDQYNDGQRYLKYYVPVSSLRPIGRSA